MLIDFCYSAQGKSHEEKNLPCQDFSYSTQVIDKSGLNWAIAAVADGVGSCSNSQYGSETAVMSAVHYIMDFIQGETLSTDTILPMIEHAFEKAAEAVIEKADEMQMPPITFDTTLTVVLMNENNLFYGHCGDGGIVVLYEDGKYEMLSSRHKGEEASSVYPLRVREEWEFGSAEKRVASVALMTDGVLDFVVGGAELNNRVYYPFFRPIMTAHVTIDSSSEDGIALEKNNASEALKSYVQKALDKEEYRAQVRDDLSLAAILSIECIQGLPVIDFSQEQWDLETMAFEEEKKKALAAQAQDQARRYAHIFEKNNSEFFNGHSEVPDNKKETDDTRQRPSRWPAKEIRQVVQGVSLIFDAAVQIGSDLGTQARDRINKSMLAREDRKSMKKANSPSKREIERKETNAREKPRNCVRETDKYDRIAKCNDSNICSKSGKDVKDGNTAGKPIDRK